MCSDEVTADGLRCVLAFEAESAGMRLLRRTVRDQLAEWGMLALSDEVQLAVTELASNVIKHVGEGASSALVMEPREGVLRVEVYDTSHAVPVVRDPQCGAECGRGLHLLAGMSANWGTTPTATGKAVWCEFAIEAAHGHCPRVRRAMSVMENYRLSVDGRQSLGVSRMPVLQESATELIADLLHWLSAQGGDPDEILDRAQMHFEADAA
ncbi:ATP-binding protein [Streptomyces sp. NBC_00838]|uniref:ATP-binding protein n=1 Tax=Streptomyces sp. NBC_00838 TaxID=2903680 RepID=UPI0038668348|nr:ATP-binding protein [Streptomyces sp. NBC_00838]